MKRLTVLLVMVAIVAAAAAAESAGARGFLAGVEVGGGAGAATLDGEPVVTIDVAATTEAARWVDVGVRVGAVHTLERSYKDDEGRAYQAEVAQIQAMLRPKLALGDRVDVGLLLGVGNGLLQFRYEHEYRDEMTWTEEMLDRVSFVMYSAGADVRVGLGTNLSLYGEGGYRATGYLETPLMDDDALVGPYARAGVTYSIR